MRALISSFVLASLASLASIVNGGCALGPVEQRCNSDVECASRSCVLGACRDRAHDAPIEDALVDDGAAPTDDVGNNVDDVDEIECTAETGFVVFDDLDLDGFGAGAPRCSFEIGAGVSELGDDCDDADASVHALTTVFDDADGDGFTKGGSRLACVSENAPPPGVRLARSDAPVHLVAPARLDPVEGDWDGRVFDPVAAAPAGTLDVGQFACAAVPERVSGIEVRLLVEDLVHDTPREISVGLRVHAPNGQVSEPLFAYVDIEGYASFTHGGPGDTLGLVGLTPEIICDPDLFVRVTIDGEDTVTSLFFVEVSLAVFGVDDCDDTLDESFSPAHLVADDDGDEVGAGFAADECVGGEIPYGLAVRDGDCAPADPRAFPGQTRMFTSPRQGVGGFDFNCDEQVEREDESVFRIVDNSCSFDGSFCNWSQNQVNPSCGASVPVFGHCASGCNLATFTQRCR